MARPTPKPDANFAHAIPGPSNEELLAQQAKINAEREASGLPRVEFSRDAFDKDLHERRNSLDYDPLAELNPLQAAVAAHRKPGMAYKALSDRVNNYLGLRGYQIVKNANGDPVKIGTMVLGEIPQHIADARQRKAQKEDQDNVGDIQQDYESKVETVAAEARRLGLQVMRPGEQFSGQSGTVNGPNSGGVASSGSVGIEFTRSSSM